MAKTLQVTSDATTAFGSNFYVAIGAGVGYGNLTFTEADAQGIYRSAGTLSNLLVIATAGDATGSSNIKTRKNAVDGNQVVTFTSGANTGTYEDTTNTDTIVAADKIAYHFTLGTHVSVDPTIRLISTLFAATTNTVSMLTIAPNQSITTAATFFYTIGGAGVGGATELNTKTRIRRAGTLKNMMVRLNANTWNATETFKVRKNGADGNQACAFAASSGAGFVEDTTNTDTVAAGDDVNYTIVTTGAGSLTIKTILTNYENTSSYGMTVVGASGGLSQNISLTEYYPVGGLLRLNTTESTTQAKAQVPFTFSDLTIDIAVAGTATLDLRYRKGGANGNQVVNYSGTGTGAFSDTTHTDVATATDLINYQSITGTGGATTIANIVMNSQLPVTIPQTVFIEWEES